MVWVSMCGSRASKPYGNLGNSCIPTRWKVLHKTKQAPPPALRLHRGAGRLSLSRSARYVHDMTDTLSAPSPRAADYPALRVLADVASYLEAGIGSEAVFQGILGALERGLGARECRVWIRTPDGSEFHAISSVGSEAHDPQRSDRVARWVAQGEAYEAVPGAWHVRLP